MATISTRAMGGTVLLRDLVVECPTTGLLVDTGKEVEARPRLAGPQLLVDCPECGEDHPWRLEDAFPE